MKCDRKSTRFLIGFSLAGLLPLAILAWLALCHAAAAEAPGREQKRVLVIHSSRREAPYTALIESAYRKTLSDGLAGRLDYYTEYVDLSRFSSPEYQEVLPDFLRRKYAGRRLDVIIAEGNAPFEFVARHGAKIFPGAPLVFSTEERDLRPIPNSTGLVFQIDMKSTLDLALRLQPNIKRVFVIRGASEFDKFYEKIARQQFQEYEGRVTFTYLPPMPLKDLLEEAPRLPEDSIIYFVSMFEDGAGDRFIPVDILDKLSPLASVPVYCWPEMTIDHGTVGGNLLSEENVAQQTAELALRVLRGENPDRIPIAKIRPYINVFNWRQLRRWGIREDQLPSGSLVRFKDPTFWEQYKSRVIAALGVMVVQTLLIGFFLLERNRRRRATQGLRKSEAKFSGILSIAADAIISIDDSHKITLFNEGAERIFGYSKDEVLGQPLDLLIPEKFRSYHRQHIQRFAAAPVASRRMGERQEIFACRKGGEEFPAEASISKLEVGGEKILTVVLRDITERRRTEERFRRFFELPLVGMAITSPDRRFLVVNQSLCDMLGYAEEELTGKTWVDVTHPEDIAENIRLLEQALKGETDGYRMEKRYIHRDGRVVYASISSRCVWRVDGTVDHLVLIIEDITERKQAEQSLQQAFTRIEQLKEQLQAENLYLQEEITLNHNFDEIVGESKELKYVFHKVEQVAPADTTVLLLGETGTGKELVARAIHRSSPRKDRPFIRVNCAALPASLIENELFGHEKGAFTGANARKLGRFEMANEGTLFLDEVGELPLELQSKLLRVLQEGELERLGGSQTIKVNLRIIAATNRKMQMQILNGLFREDLWYRLSVFPITLPPLRQRQEDIPLLVNHFVNIFSRKLGKHLKSVAPGTMKALQDYTWPGNIRELANVIERAVINAQGPVLYLAEKLNSPRTLNVPSLNGQGLAEMERDLILQRLEEVRWKIEGPGGAAQSLGLKPSTLRERMSKHGIRRSNSQH